MGENMIDADVLIGYRTFKDPYQTEKDYLQDLVLYGVYAGSVDAFVFKGGTALSKFYYSDRFSEDVDFTLQSKESDFADIKAMIDKVVESFPYKIRYKEAPSMNKFGTVIAVLAIEGPRYNRKQSTLQYLKFEISTRGSILCKPAVLPRAPVYADARKYIAVLMDRKEILS